MAKPVHLPDIRQFQRLKANHVLYDTCCCLNWPALSCSFISPMEARFANWQAGNATLLCIFGEAPFMGLTPLGLPAFRLSSHLLPWTTQRTAFPETLHAGQAKSFRQPCSLGRRWPVWPAQLTPCPGTRLACQTKPFIGGCGFGWLGDAAGNLVDEAYQRWLVEEEGVVDDITAVVVKFIHPKP
eukprot:1141252-Pelagomonas_calceolata.AAC.6